MGGNKDKSLSAVAAELRRQAEERLRAKTAESIPPGPGRRPSGSSMNLRSTRSNWRCKTMSCSRARNELELSRNQYAELYDFAPVGYFTLDTAGLIWKVNFVGAHLLGMERQLLANKPLSSFIADADGREIFSNHLKSVLKRKGMQRCEIGFTGKDGQVVQGLLQSVATDIIEGKDCCILSSFVDSTVDRQLRDELQESHDSLESIVKERTADLLRANQQLLGEIEDRKQAAKSLREALSIIKQLKDQLQEENIYLKEEINLLQSHKDIVGNSEAIRTVLKQIEQVAETDSTVLIQGETGTGKELVANAIHGLSSRKDRLMIKVNCAALPPTLIESELFGREKGAFTGSLSKQIGRFELADASTIFLDEIDALPLDLQAKLLRVLESGEFERLGSPRTVKVDVRIISATNRDLARLVSEGGFREDLYYRLNVFQIIVPPLRERREDILPLVWSFVQELSKRMGKRIESIPQKDVEALQAYPWPGNVRELRNVTERAMIITTGPVLHLDVPKIAQSGAEQSGTLEEVEKRHIIEALNTTGWRVSGKGGAAELLGINPKTLESRIQRLGIQRNKPR